MTALLRPRLKTLLMTAAMASALTFAGGAGAESLGDAISAAYATNPTLLRQRAAQRASDESYVQTRSRMGPSVGLGGSVNYTDRSAPIYDSSGDRIGSVGRSNTSLNLSAEQALFASGGLTSQLDSSEANIMSGQASLRGTETQIILSVISSYTAVRRGQAALAIAQESYDTLSRQLEQTRAQFEAGQLTRTDVAQAEARVAGARAQLSATRAQLDSDRATYQALVGQVPVALEPEPALPGLPATFDDALAIAERNNPELTAALYAQQAAEADVRTAQSAFGPTVSLSAGLSQQAPTDGLSALGDSTAATASLRFSVPLYSSGLNSSRVRAASEVLTAQRMTVEQVRRQVVADVSQAWSNMLAAQAAVTANEEQVRATAVAAEGVKIEYDAGLRTTIEVLNAEQELRAAQLQLLDAQRNYYLMGSQLLAVMGGLTPDIFAPGVEIYDPSENLERIRSKGWSPFVPVARTLDGLVSGR